MNARHEEEGVQEIFKSVDVQCRYFFIPDYGFLTDISPCFIIIRGGGQTTECGS